MADMGLEISEGLPEKTSETYSVLSCNGRGYVGHGGRMVTSCDLMNFESVTGALDDISEYSSNFNVDDAEKNKARRTLANLREKELDERENTILILQLRGKFLGS